MQLHAVAASVKLTDTLLPLSPDAGAGPMARLLSLAMRGRYLLTFVEVAEELPAASRATTRSVWTPGATLRVFQR